MQVRPLDLSPAGLERTRALLRVVFPHATHIDTGYLDRLYNGNPVGPTIGLAAYDDADELIGHYLMLPVRSLLKGEEALGIWPFQLAVHPAHRGKSVFTALLEGSVGLQLSHGYDYIVGITNAQSAPIYQKRFGCQILGPLDVKIGVGAPPPGRPLEGADYRRLWDPAGIAWRCGLPARPYVVERRGECGHLYADAGRFGIQVEVGSFPLDDLPRGLRPRGALRPLRLWIGRDPTRDWSGSAWFDVPMRLRSSPLLFTFGDFSGRHRRLDPARSQFEVFDFDAY